MKIQSVTNVVLCAGVLALFSAPVASFAERTKPYAHGAAESEVIEVQQSRSEIDAMAKESLQELTSANEAAKHMQQQSKGYAVFQATKAGLLITGAGGSGVVVDTATQQRTYMRMGSGGVGLGAGIQSYRLVVFFETQDALKHFIDGSWDASTSAQAAAGKSGVNAASSFVDHVAVFQLTNKGLMAQADLTGTRFWKSESLNF